MSTEKIVQEFLIFFASRIFFINLKLSYESAKTFTELDFFFYLSLCVCLFLFVVTINNHRNLPKIYFLYPVLTLVFIWFNSNFIFILLVILTDFLFVYKIQRWEINLEYEVIQDEENQIPQVSQIIRLSERTIKPIDIDYILKLGQELEEECAICLDLMKIGTIAKLDCGHIFCKKCIEKWRNCNKFTCPVCRSTIVINNQYI